jgi:hypothetical protein
MEIDSPVWHLREVCPVCEQGEALTLIACPGCSHISVECAEEGTVFPSLASVREGKGTHEGLALCPSCQDFPFSNFRPALSDEIRAAGLTPSQYQ